MKMKTLWLSLAVILLAVSSVLAIKIELENLPEKCDFRRCTAPDSKKLNVHLVPHTHDDVGWLKTVDQYFYGARNNIQNAGVQYILDSVVEELIRGKDRRFIYVETAFFWKWWTEQNQEQQDIVRELVKSGQLEFINGGWSMNDEATTHYNSIIDQMTWGLRRLNDTFGKCGIPRVAWQIDPFGHSREMANLFAAMNFDALFFAREDYQDLAARIANNTLEHMWQGSDDLGTAGDLLTGMMSNHYGPLKGLLWDIVDNEDDPIVDNVESEEYNVDKVLDKVMGEIRKFKKGYPTNNIMIPMGEDFQYQHARHFYKNLDKFIKTMTAKHGDEVKVFYSTPSCYAKALHDSNVTFTSKKDDFFPYANAPHSYWTGYFTSRPALKRFERIGNTVLQACKQLDVLAGNGVKYEAQVTALRETMGVMQHHDAVTGTEKEHVTSDYAKLLDRDITGCQSVISQSISGKLLPGVGSSVFCPYLNVSSCAFTETRDNFTVTLYNPLGHTLKGWTVRVPVASKKDYRVVNDKGEMVASVLVPVPEAVAKLAERPTRVAQFELVFTVDAIGPLALKSLAVQATAAATPKNVVEGKKITAPGVKLVSKGMTLIFDEHGEVSQVQLADGSKVALKNELHFYKSAFDKIKPSGAYAFRPAEQKTEKIGSVVEATVFSSGAVQEVHQRFSVDWVSQVVRLLPEEGAIEFEWLVGPIPVADGIGREVVAKYATDLVTGKDFWTDANGRQLLKRTIDYRPSWKLSVDEPVSGNYYPVNSRLVLRDQARKLALSVLTDRSQGGTSLQNGTAELMLHRRLLHDDSYGVGEPLNEPGTDGKGLIVRGRHRVLLSSLAESASQHRKLSQQFFLEPVMSFAPSGANQKLSSYQGLTVDLPANVHLLTLESWSGGRVLLRLEHFYQRDEDSQLSAPATVNLRHLLTAFDVLSAQELTLSANAPVSVLQSRLVYKYTPLGTVRPAPATSLDATKLEVTLEPMQIRTFLLTVKAK